MELDTEETADLLFLIVSLHLENATLRAALEKLGVTGIDAHLAKAKRDPEMVRAALKSIAFLKNDLLPDVDDQVLVDQFLVKLQRPRWTIQ